MARSTFSNPHVVSSRSSSTDKAPQLVGQLNSDGIASLEADPVYIPRTRSNPPRSLKTALDAVASTRRSGSRDNVSETSEEDYDSLTQDHLAMRENGGGFGPALNGTSTPEVNRNRTYDELGAPPVHSPGPLKLQSIPVTLNKLKEKGRYILTADDEALKEILRSGLDRERNPATAKKRRTKFSDIIFTRQFTAFDRQNTDSAESPFHGFFTLFWLGTFIYMIKLVNQNWHQYGNILGSNEVTALMFHRDVMVLGISDGVICGITGFGLILQKAIHRGFISWNEEGWIIQSAWEVLYLLSILGWTLLREWPWTHTVFFILHGLVMLMKQHSYAFYNGHLSEEFKLRVTLEQKLKQLDDTSPAVTPSSTMPRLPASTSYLEYNPTGTGLKKRRQSEKSSLADDGLSKIDRMAATIDAGEILDNDQLQTLKTNLRWEIEALGEELKGKCTTGINSYPDNLTLVNHYEYIVLPTLVYELEYPRSNRINWYYVAEKTLAVFGILVIMNLVSQAFIYPIVMQTIEMKDSDMPLADRLRVFPSILSDLLFPFIFEYMMTWYVIWECILNVLAEITFFADRGFYADWWNSVSWDEFSRAWNRPVHNFLLRHVYHSSISTLKVNKYTATLITFFLSAIVHELVMWCLFKKLRGYLLFLQMSQIPLVQLSRSRWLKERKGLGNIIFWIGIFTGPSLLCSLYLII